MTTKPLALRLLLLQLIAALWVTAAAAHPMGNFSINHYTGIHIEKNGIELRYLIDMAEIPTHQEIQDANVVTRVGDPSLTAYLQHEAATWAANIRLLQNSEPLRLEDTSNSVIFPLGTGGLPTMKIGVINRAVLKQKLSGFVALNFGDESFMGHAGWKEIVVTAGEGISLGARADGSQPFRVDRSVQLTNDPTNLLNSPPQDLEADLDYTIKAAAHALTSDPPAGAAAAHAPSSAKSRSLHMAAAPQLPVRTPPGSTLSTALILHPNEQATPRSRFTGLMATPTAGIGFLIAAAFLAAGLGAAHALEPGHGKTIVAAYLVGSRRRTRHAIGLGLLVTASHTTGLYLLGAAVLYASKYIIPERIYPWLSIFSGLVIALMAGYLLLRAWTGFDDRRSDDGVLHAHWYSLRSNQDKLEHSLSEQTTAASKVVPLRQLLALGITGGMIPCPASLVVLLSALSMHRIGLGLFLIVAFSLGLAAVLIGIGVAMVRARHLLSRWRNDAPWVRRWLPLVSSLAMLAAGLAIAATALPATGLSFHLASLKTNQLPSFAAIVALGLFLGIRHSTDPDHVVAVSTIVTRERSVKQGALIGMMWGFGHTLTIFVVGAAIILFKLTIPPRLGLSMEMAVAAMLILLGILNLTGVLRRLTGRLTPDARNLDGAPAPPSANDSNAWHRRIFRKASGLVDRYGYYQLVRPLAIGLVHGLAGSAAVALLVLSMIPNPAWAVMYLVIFGLGTVAGMMLMTTAMAIPIALTGKSSSRYLTLASGLVSICFGLFLVYQIGFVDGLFTKHVHWTPS